MQSWLQLQQEAAASEDADLVFIATILKMGIPAETTKGVLLWRVSGDIGVSRMQCSFTMHLRVVDLCHAEAEQFYNAKYVQEKVSCGRPKVCSTIVCSTIKGYLSDGLHVSVTRHRGIEA